MKLIEDFECIYHMVRIISETHFINDLLNFLINNLSTYGEVLFEKFDKIFMAIPPEDKKNSNILLNKVVSLIEDENKYDFAFLMKYFDKVLAALQSHEIFLGLLNKKFQKFEEFLVANTTQYEIVLFFKSLAKCDHIWENSDLLIKINNFTQNFIKESPGNDTKLIKNYKTQKSAVKILPLILKYSLRNMREEVMKWFETEIVENSSYFRRRFFLTFFKAASKVLSCNFLKENGILQIAFKFFSDLEVFLPKLISIFNIVSPLVLDDPKFKEILFMSVKSIKTQDRETLSEIENFNKNLSLYEDDHNPFQPLFAKDAEKLKQEQDLHAKEIIIPIKEDKKNKKFFSKKSGATNKSVLKVSCIQNSSKKENVTREILNTETTSRGHNRKGSFINGNGKDLSVDRKSIVRDSTRDNSLDRNKVQNNNMKSTFYGTKSIKTIITVKDSGVLYRKKK